MGVARLRGIERLFPVRDEDTVDDGGGDGCNVLLGEGCLPDVDTSRQSHIDATRLDELSWACGGVGRHKDDDLEVREFARERCLALRSNHV